MDGYSCLRDGPCIGAEAGRINLIARCCSVSVYLTIYICLSILWVGAIFCMMGHFSKGLSSWLWTLAMG